MAEESVETSVLGVPLRLRGKDLFPWILVVILLGALAWMVNFSLGMWGQPIDLHAQFLNHRDETAKEHKQVGGEVDSLNYTIAVCMNPNRREECYRLSDRSMPEALKEKLRR